MLVLSVCFRGFGQDKVLQNTNVDELKKLESEFSTAYLERKARVEAYAKENNLLVDHYLPSGKVVSMVDIDEFGKPVYIRTDNNSTASATISTNRVYPSTTAVNRFNLSGRGFTIGEWDGGRTLITHNEFEGRATQADNGTTALSEHATHVAGTLIAGGVGSVNLRGMAYKAKLLANDWNNDDGEMASRASQGLMVSNHSYGEICGWEFNETNNQWEWNGNASINPTYDYRFGFYNSRAQSWDRMSFNAPYYLIVKSAGNTRGGGPSDPNIPNNGPYDCLPTYSVAKNILTVGAVNGLTNGYVNANGVVMSTFSSWGPADDGRIKPDIVGNGVNVTSTGSASNTQTVTLSGTSMSGPSVAGSCLLLQEHYSNTHKSRKMRSATLKGLVIHTADECWTFPGPDYRFGWGLMNTRKAATVISNDSVFSAIVEDQLNNLQVKEYTITAKGNETLTATLCWTDVAGTPGPAAYNSRLKMLVNDLDMRLINESNQSETLPWRLNPDSTTNRAVKADNSVDNVEKIELPGATAGQTYRIRISHKGNLFTNATIPQNQKYSLIVSGIMVGDTNRTCRPLQTFNSSSGIFDDGSGSAKNYFNNADCSWLLNPVDSGAVVQLIFRNFNLAAGDTLYCYSRGAGDTLIGKFSGNTLPDTIVSSTPKMFLNFKTNGSGTSSGWEVRYSAVVTPKFDFTASTRLLCSGSNTIQFTVQPQSTLTSDWLYQWNIQGGTPQNPTTSNPSVSFASPGVYAVSLTVRNSVGSTTVTKTNYITVGNGIAPNDAPYGENFEIGTFPNYPSNPSRNWTTTADPNPWVRNTLAPYEGLAAMRIRNNTTAVSVRDLVSPGINISGIPAQDRKIVFYMAFARTSTATASDQLRVLISTNCGQTWSEVWKKSNTTPNPLSTIGNTATDVVPGNFIPEPFQYRKDSISLSSLPQNTSNLMVKFEMTSQRGNFLYLDDVRVGNLTTAQSEILAAADFKVNLFPNPTSGESTIEIRNLKSSQVQISLTDLAGREIARSETAADASESLVQISSQKAFGKVNNGFYFIRIRNGASEKVIRWIVQ
jgi:PKD repeat protein